MSTPEYPRSGEPADRATSGADAQGWGSTPPGGTHYSSGEHWPTGGYGVPSDPYPPSSALMPSHDSGYGPSTYGPYEQYGTPGYGYVPWGPYPVYNVVTPTSGLAVASMVCGIIGFFVLGVTSIPAVVCGHLAWPRTSTGDAEGHGMAIAGLVMGYLQIVGWVLFWLFWLFVIGAATSHG